MAGQPDLAARLRSEMDQRHLTIEQLAERSGCGRNTVGGVLRREVLPTIPTIERLAEGIGVTPAWLAFGVRVER